MEQFPPWACQGRSQASVELPPIQALEASPSPSSKSGRFQGRQIGSQGFHGFADGKLGHFLRQGGLPFCPPIAFG